MVKYQYQVLCREKKQKRAFSLVELSIVVGVIGVLLGGIWILMVQGSQTAERQQVLQQVGVVVENVRDYYAGQLGVPASGAAYSFLSNAVTLGLVPTYMVRPAALAATTCTNPTALCADGPWGSALDPDTHGSFRVCPWTPGAVPLASVTGGCLQGAVAGTTTSFFFVFLSVPDNGACIQLATQISSASGPKGLVDVVINSTSIALGLGDALPVSGTDASKYCVGGAGGVANRNYLYFVYRLVKGSS